ncbi:PTS sugar transporter subunit IIA [Corynebacterium sp. ES2775-CONJ]|uniref:PTS sugar transporter subunit IIA n=1 Tax=Corynebacterium sp. ES2775-CONJ TaxID=2974029 RepID=UPI00216A598B|nr:PTS sugar transporter subunit IIA [Corynebacterium sp. ES2775-CONJ]MCS4490320.1 PTS sugar transporter subunit IIA [Corynebacterium sp. ES2775-CONJ]
MSTLSELLPPSRVTLDIEVDTWENAIIEAGKLLERDGMSTSVYTRDMVRTVQEQGPYIVLAPGFALAHARPSQEVKATAFSAVRLAHPVRFGHESNDPVTLVFAMAAVDSVQHMQAMKEIARIISEPEKKRRLLAAGSAEEFVSVCHVADSVPKPQKLTKPAESDIHSKEDKSLAEDAVPSTGKVLTVCGNGLGTSLFLKSSLDELLSIWGWSRYLTVEATDTISAKGKAKDADAILTSGAIAQTLGDLGIPIRIINNFTSLPEIDAALRSIYAVD